MTFVSDPLVHDVIGCAKTEVPVSILYRGLRLDGGYPIDLLVEGRLIVEIKAVEVLQPIHTAQVLTYLRLSGVRQGLIINFNCPRLKDGLKSVLLRPHPGDPSRSSPPSTE